MRRNSPSSSARPQVFQSAYSSQTPPCTRTQTRLFTFLQICFFALQLHWMGQDKNSHIIFLLLLLVDSLHEFHWICYMRRCNSITNFRNIKVLCSMICPFNRKTAGRQPKTDKNCREIYSRLGKGRVQSHLWLKILFFTYFWLKSSIFWKIPQDQQEISLIFYLLYFWTI